MSTATNIILYEISKIKYIHIYSIIDGCYSFKFLWRNVNYDLPLLLDFQTVSNSHITSSLPLSWSRCVYIWFLIFHIIYNIGSSGQFPLPLYCALPIATLELLYCIFTVWCFIFSNCQYVTGAYLFYDIWLYKFNFNSFK